MADSDTTHSREDRARPDPERRSQTPGRGAPPQAGRDGRGRGERPTARDVAGRGAVTGGEGSTPRRSRQGDGSPQRSGRRPASDDTRGTTTRQRRVEPREKPTGRHPDPEVPDDVTGAELDRHVRGELGTLSNENAAGVARHLVMVGRLLEEDPEAAYAHAMAAQRRAGRVALVREAAGLAAYRCDRFDEALRELRTARRLSGSQEQLPVMADCERGLGRPERALAMLTSPEAAALDRTGSLELLMVAAGARLDLGQAAAAVVMLEVAELTGPVHPETAQVQARLMSAYSDALEAAGRSQESRSWLERAAAADVDGVTGAADRLDGPGDGDIVDLLDDEEDPDRVPGTPQDRR